VNQRVLRIVVEPARTCHHMTSIKDPSQSV
jgi:hypothetical protein